VNKAGAFNTPWGYHEKLSLPSLESLKAWSDALFDAVLMCADFEDATRCARPGDWAYFDPPYIPVKPGGFTGYQAEKFGRADHERLAKCAARLAEKGVHVILSNSDTALTRELYPRERFEIFEVTRNGTMNSNGAKRGKVKELLMRGIL
jgi:DNA adenine methylase